MMMFDALAGDNNDALIQRGDYLARWSEDDCRYLKSLGAKDPNQVGFTPDDTVAKALKKGDGSKTGASVYVDSCAACHKTGWQRQ